MRAIDATPANVSAALDAFDFATTVEKQERDAGDRHAARFRIGADAAYQAGDGRRAAQIG